MNAIRNALIELGYKVNTAITISAVLLSRAVVYIAGEPFGIWDFEKRTFVD